MNLSGPSLIPGPPPERRGSGKILWGFIIRTHNLVYAELRADNYIIHAPSVIMLK